MSLEGGLGLTLGSHSSALTVEDRLLEFRPPCFTQNSLTVKGAPSCCTQVSLAVEGGAPCFMRSGHAHANALAQVIACVHAAICIHSEQLATDVPADTKQCACQLSTPHGVGAY